MNHSLFRPDHLAARAVNRALGDLRRGIAVTIIGEGPGLDEGEGAERAVALAVETATEASLEEFLAAAEAAPVLLLAHARAADLGLPREGRAPSVAVRLDRPRPDLRALLALADPTLPQGARPDPAANPHAPEIAAAGLALAKLAGLLPAVLMARAAPPTGALLCVNASAVAGYRLDSAEHLERVAEARVPLEEAEDVRVISFRPPDGGTEHKAILIGRPEAADTPLVRVHSECFTGDILGSRRCDCGPQLHQAIRRMQAEGAGVILYMAQEGRGIGLANKLRAYRLQDEGLDTIDANRALGFGADERSFAPAATMLRALGITRIRLLTNNPAKMAGLAAHGIDIAGRLSHAIAANGENDAYLETKALRFGHLLG
jgi:GTP cyclohydrolase II